MLAELDKIATTSNEVYLPVILTGDFNLQPYSAPYNLITSGILKYEGLKAKTLENTNVNDPETSGKTLLPSSLGITDNCQHVNVVNERLNERTTKRKKTATEVSQILRILNFIFLIFLKCFPVIL